jgi:iron complex outermembrane receptor protein
MPRLDHRTSTVTGQRARRALMLASMLTCVSLSVPAFAADAPAPAPAPAPEPDPAGEQKPDIVVQGSLGALPLKDVGSVFGFNKTLVETPRSASTVSKEQMERFGITQIYDLVSQAPGTFTSSFLAPARWISVARLRTFTIAACCGWTIRATIPPRSVQRTASTSCAGPPA